MPEARWIALLSRSSTLLVAGVSVLFSNAFATVDTGMLINVGKPQVMGFSTNLATLSIGRLCSLPSSQLQHTSKPTLVAFLWLL